MPILSVQFHAQMQPSALLQKEGPKVPVEISLPARLEDLLRKENKPVPDPAKGIALIDTGATISMVDEEVVQHLCLPGVGSVMLGTAGGGKFQSVLYPVKLAIVIPPNPPLVAAEVSQISAGPLKPQGLLCLLGRDVLRHGLFVYDGAGGHFTIAF